MTVTTGPTPIVSLAGVLAAAPSWVAAGLGATQIYWPEVTPSQITTTPIAQLSLIDPRAAEVNLFVLESYTEEALADLAEDLKYELPTRYRTTGTGVFVAVNPEVSQVYDYSDAQSAGTGKEAICITITLRIGVDSE